MEFRKNPQRNLRDPKRIPRNSKGTLRESQGKPQRIQNTPKEILRESEWYLWNPNQIIRNPKATFQKEIKEPSRGSEGSLRKPKANLRKSLVARLEWGAGVGRIPFSFLTFPVASNPCLGVPLRFLQRPLGIAEGSSEYLSDSLRIPLGFPQGSLKIS